MVTTRFIMIFSRFRPMFGLATYRLTTRETPSGYGTNDGAMEDELTYGVSYTSHQLHDQPPQ